MIIVSTLVSSFWSHPKGNWNLDVGNMTCFGLVIITQQTPLWIYFRNFSSKSFIDENFIENILKFIVMRVFNLIIVPWHFKFLSI